MNLFESICWNIVKFLFWLSVVVFIVGSLFLIIFPGDLDCSDYSFIDINGGCKNIILNITGIGENNFTYVNKSTCNSTVSEFKMEEVALTFRKEINILDNNNNKIGSFFQIIDGGNVKYRYKAIISNSEEYVVGQIENIPFGGVSRFFLSRCNQTGSVFILEEKSVTLDDLEYKLYKDDILIGETNDDIIALCKPDLSLVDLDNNPIAILRRGCGSTFVDKWNIINFQDNLIDNYVIGFIAYITTLNENRENDNSIQFK
jgi:hypothetical protein